MRLFQLYRLRDAASSFARVVPAQSVQLAAESGLSQHVEHAFHGCQFEMFLADHQVVALAGERQEVQPESARGGAGGDAAIGQAGIDAPGAARWPAAESPS